MKPIVSFIAALFTVSLFTQCTPKASSEQPRSNIDIATEIVEEVFNAYPDSAWAHESCLSDILILKVGTTIGHQDNDTLKFLDLVTRINRKIESIRLHFLVNRLQFPKLYDVILLVLFLFYYQPYLNPFIFFLSFPIIPQIHLF